MSEYSSSGYTLSRAEQARLERERQERLEEERKRQEEERKRQLELMRQRMIAEERERVAWASHFSENMREYRLAVLTDRINAIQQTTATRPGGAEHGRKAARACAGLLKRLRSADIEQMDKLETEIGQLQQDYLPTSSNTTLTGTGDVLSDKRAKRQEAQQLLSRVSTCIAVLPQELRETYHDQVDRITQALELADREKETDLTLHSESLRWAEMELLHIGRQFEARRKLTQKRLVRSREAINGFIVRMKTAQTLAVLPEQREKAGLLAQQLEQLYQQGNPDVVDRELATIRGAVNDLWKDCEDVRKKDQERAAVRAIVEETLAEMGYEVIPLLEVPTPPRGHSTRTQFKTTDSEAVEVSLGLDESVQFQFQHLVHEGDRSGTEAEKEALVTKCGRWCRDHDELIKRLRPKGVVLDPRWRVAPGEREIRSVCLPAEAAEPPEKMKRLRRRREEQRRATE
jgi:hypothetical protein